MSNSDNDTEDTKPAKSLSLKRSGSDTGRVKQSFSHGRSKTVVVEKKPTKRKRVVAPRDGAALATPKPAAPKKPAAKAPEAKTEKPPHRSARPRARC